MFFLSWSDLGECGLVALVSPLPPSSVCLMLSDWREGLGDGSVLLPVGLNINTGVKKKENATVEASEPGPSRSSSPTHGLRPSSSVLPHQGVVLLNLPADEVMAGEDGVLKGKRERGRKETTGGLYKGVLLVR